MSGRWSSWSLQSGQSGCGGSGSAGQHGTSNYDAWATWTCGHCQTVNWANYGSQKKRCSTCGIKKSYRDAALGGHAHGPPQSQQNAVRSQIQSVQAQLANPVLRIPAVACAPPPLDAALRAASDASPAGPVDRKAILADIKELEGLAAGIQNPALMHIKDELNERISQKKNLLHKTRPPGVQLDGARDLVSTYWPKPRRLPKQPMSSLPMQQQHLLRSRRIFPKQTQAQLSPTASRTWPPRSRVSSQRCVAAPVSPSTSSRRPSSTCTTSCVVSVRFQLQHLLLPWLLQVHRWRARQLLRAMRLLHTGSPRNTRRYGSSARGHAFKRPTHTQWWEPSLEMVR
jgi:hypothetical protein